METGNILKQIQNNNRCVCVSDNIIITATEDAATIFYGEAYDVINTINRKYIRNIYVTHNNKKLIILHNENFGENGSEFSIYDISNGNLLISPNYHISSRKAFISFDNKLIANSYGQILIFDLDIGRLINKISGENIHYYEKCLYVSNYTSKLIDQLKKLDH